MAANPRTTLLHHIRHRAGAGPERPSDRELLGRFAARGDEAAFEAILRRHGPLVLGIGRRLLGNAHDAEEVFQATFLVLAKKARSVCWQESISSWLAEVARRLALQTRDETARRRERETRAPERRGADPLADLSLREVQAIVEEEMGQLPSSCRMPLELCCLQGHSRDEAARQLGLPLGTLKRRLEQGRQLLRARLGRRGLTLSGALLAVELCGGPAEAVPAELLSATSRAAVATVPSATVAKGKLVGAMVLAALIAGTAGLVARSGVDLPPVVRRMVSAAPVPAGQTDVPLPPGALAQLGAVGMRHGYYIGGSTLSPDGRLLATSSGFSVAVWDLQARKRLHLFPFEPWSPSWVAKLAFSPDGKLLGYVLHSRFACVWNLKTGKEALRVEGTREANYLNCRFSPDGKEFVLNGQEQIEFWDLTSGKRSRLVQATYTRPTADAISADGKTSAVVEENKRVQVRDVADGKLLASITLPDSAQRMRAWSRVNLSADGRTLLLGNWDGLVHRWDIATRKELPPLKKHLSETTRAHAPAGGRTVISTGADGLIRIWDARTAREVAEPESYVGRTYAAYSPRGRLAAVGDAQGRLDLWNAATGKRLRQFRPVGPAIEQLAFSPDGKSLAAACADGKLRFWDVASGREGKAIDAKGQYLDHAWTMAFSPDGRSLCVTVSSPGKMHLYEIATGKVLWRGSSAGCAAAFTPDGATLAVSDGPFPGEDRKRHVALLDAATGRLRLNVRVQGAPGSHPYGVDALSIAPDGEMMALAPVGGVVYLCDARTGEELQRFRAVPSPQMDSRAPPDEVVVLTRVGAVAFSPDSKLLVSGGSDGVVRLWEVATGEKVLERKGHDSLVYSATFSEDGRSVLTSGADGQVYLWDLRPPGLPGPRPSLESLWDQFNSARAADAYRAVWAMSETAAAAEFLRKRIRPAQPVARTRLAKLIAELNSDRFAVREAAMVELQNLGEQAAPALRQALEMRPVLEAQHRIRRLLDALKKGPPPTELRQLRAVQALELAGTPAARQVLKTWAGGAAEARLSREAKAALHRLEDRSRSSP